MSSLVYTTKRKKEMSLSVEHTWSVKALVCLVTKKFVKFTKYARVELNNRYHISLKSSLASAIVMPTTFSSITNVAGSNKITAIGAM